MHFFSPQESVIKCHLKLEKKNLLFHIHIKTDHTQLKLYLQSSPIAVQMNIKDRKNKRRCSQKCANFPHLYINRKSINWKPSVISIENFPYDHDHDNEYDKC